MSRGVVFLPIHTPGEEIGQIRRLFDLKKVSLTSAIDEGADEDTGGARPGQRFGVSGYPTIILIAATVRSPLGMTTRLPCLPSER